MKDIKSIDFVTGDVVLSEDKPRPARAGWLPIADAPKDGTEVFVGCWVASVWITRGAHFVRSEEWMPNLDDNPDGWWSYCNSVSQELLEGRFAPTHFCTMPPLPPDPVHS